MRRAEVPRSWRRVALKRLFRIVNGSTPKSDEPAYWDGDIPWVTPDDLGALTVPEVVSSQRLITQEGYRSCGTSLVPAGSLVISTRAPIGYVAITTTAVCTNQGCKCLVATGDLSARFFYYQLLGAQPELVSYGQGSTFAELAATKLGAISLLVPPRREQDALAAFLDRETARIDALIAKNGRLLALLKEKRTALITRAVTKGLDPTVPMKDSGVEWLGKVPAHWEVKRLWHLTPSDRRIMYGIVLPGPNVDDGVPIVKGGDVSRDRLRLDALCRTTFEIESGYARSRLRGGDLVLAIRGSIGEVAMVPDELQGANLTQDAARVAYTSQTLGPWLLYALQSTVVFAQLEAGALGATIRGINIRDLKRASIPVPARVEQQRIAAFLNEATARIDALARKVRDAIAILREYRTALISAAVTGQIDVSGAGAAGKPATRPSR